MPTADELARALALHDPELVEASHEVDLTLLRWTLGLTPLERLRTCIRNSTTLEALRRGAATRATPGRQRRVVAAATGRARGRGR